MGSSKTRPWNRPLPKPKERNRRGMIRLKRMGDVIGPHPRRGLKFAYPFATLQHGMLLHRVRSAYQFRTVVDRDAPSTSFVLWCGNHAADYGRPAADGEPINRLDPGERLVCHRCEVMAVAAGEPTASEYAGRHVHTGALSVRQVCCTRERDSN